MKIVTKIEKTSYFITLILIYLYFKPKYSFLIIFITLLYVPIECMNRLIQLHFKYFMFYLHNFTL